MKQQEPHEVQSAAMAARVTTQRETNKQATAQGVVAKQATAQGVVAKQVMSPSLQEADDDQPKDKKSKAGRLHSTPSVDHKPKKRGCGTFWTRNGRTGKASWGPVRHPRVDPFG